MSDLKKRLDSIDKKIYAIAGFTAGVSIITFILLISGASAAGMTEPCPIPIKIVTVDGVGIDGLHVTLKSEAGVVVAQDVTVNGEILFELGGVSLCSDVAGNPTTYYATVEECKDKGVCTKPVQFSSSGMIIWELTESVPVTTTTTVPVETEVDTTAIVASFLSALGVGGAAIGIYIKKGRIAISKKNLEKIIEAMPKGCGIRLTKAYNGAGSVKHWHPGRASYHSLSDKHKGKYDHNGEEKLFPDYLYEGK